MRQISIASNRGPVEITVTIGGAHFGRYRLTLWGSGGSTKAVGEGNNVDGIPDTFYQNPLDCDGMILGVEINIAAYGDEPGQHYTARVDFAQQGMAVSGSPLEYFGQLDSGVKAIIDYATMVVNQEEVA